MATPASYRVLSTILLTDTVDSTARAVELGDQRWRELLDAQEVLAERAVIFGVVVADFAGKSSLRPEAAPMSA